MSGELVLGGDPFFVHLSEHLRQEVAPYLYERKYDARQIIYFPEDKCEFVYWVHTGRVKVTRECHDNRSLTFRHLVAGDIFGEELLGGRPTQDNYAEALSASLLWLMRADDFRRLVRNEAELGLAVAVALSRRVMDLERVYAASVFCPVSSRIAWGLMRLYQKRADPGEAVVEVTHQELANLVGSTRETTTTVLHDLREAGLIELANRKVFVLDPDGLERWSCRAG